MYAAWMERVIPSFVRQRAAPGAESAVNRRRAEVHSGAFALKVASRRERVHLRYEDERLADAAGEFGWYSGVAALLRPFAGRAFFLPARAAEDRWPLEGESLNDGEYAS